MLKFDIISYEELFGSKPTPEARQCLKTSLHESGIVGVRNIPTFVEKVQTFLEASRAFSALPMAIKNQYAPRRTQGEVQGFELGAEKYGDNQQADDKKASFYAFFPDCAGNKWPHELDLKTPYLALNGLMGEVARNILDLLGLHAELGIDLAKLEFLGRMLHYHKEGEQTNQNPNWAGAHYDHGLFTGLLPAFYFQDGQEVPEPEEAGLFVRTPKSTVFEKVCAKDKSVLLFQAGEFGQLMSDDRMQATEHLVRKSFGGIERFTLATFVDVHAMTRCNSTSVLTQDTRYQVNRRADGSITYKEWGDASYARYLVA